MQNQFRIKYVKQNNTIRFEKWTNMLTTEKPHWSWWYEVDMDNASEKELEKWNEHLSGKNWITQNPELFSSFKNMYQGYLEENNS